MDPTFHPNNWGGPRSKEVFAKEELPLVFIEFLEFIQKNPNSGLIDVRNHFQITYNREISKTATSRLLKSWRWSWKVPSHVQIAKFSPQNMEYYYHFVNWLLEQDQTKLKFLDESHILPKGLRKQKCLGLVNQRVWIKASDLNQKHCSITLLSSIVNDSPFLFDIREESNSSVDFVSFVLSALSNRFINDGDIIVDNASVHKDCNKVPVLLNLLMEFNVQLVYLPTYSPELNPVELVFNKMKSEIRKTQTTLDIETRILFGLSRISLENMINFFMVIVLIEIR